MNKPNTTFGALMVGAEFTAGDTKYMKMSPWSEARVMAGTRKGQYVRMNDTLPVYCSDYALRSPLKAPRVFVEWHAGVITAAGEEIVAYALERYDLTDAEQEMFEQAVRQGCLLTANALAAGYARNGFNQYDAFYHGAPVEFVLERVVLE
jgi:hypothetical protein